MKKIYAIGAVAFMFAACRPNANVTTPATSGNANFTNYLAVGCSFTAGYGDNSLTVSGQLNSYPQRLFEQFETIKDGKGAVGPFIQPLVTGDNGYPEPKLVLSTVTHCDGKISMAPVKTTLPLDSNGSWRFVNPVNNNQVNNVSVPKLRVADIPVQGYAGPNAYARRYFYDPTKRPLDEIYARVYNVHPTFFTLWLGITDVLGYAVSGGQGNGSRLAVPVTLNIYNSNDITPDAVFAANYDSVLTALTSTGAFGALLSIPDITALPYFTTRPMNGLHITSKGFADTLMALYPDVNNKIFDTGDNYYIIRDNVGGIRQAVPGELLLITVPQDSITCAGWGSTKPIPREYVLTTDELQNIRNAVTSFNGYIQKEARDRNLPYVDMRQFFETLSTGITYNGINYSTEFVSGGAFSLDAIHLNARGNALVANKIIEAINAFFKSNIPMTDVNKYPGVKFP
ncbi:SGNH/GDSL hydrolase family protein [Nemorincola caseinilytica]|uniref:SGNH/GDSL hydrolase family protein n=1 Tax=Nemorincola caseinilytica TaxID=2054315 RepID=A0ABP8NA21_9BACT